MIATIVLVVVAIPAVLFVPQRVRLTLIAAVYPVQLFVPGAHLSVAEALVIATAAWWIVHDHARFLAVLRRPLTVVFALLWASSAVALLWTAPEARMAGANVTVRLLIFIILLMLVMDAAEGAVDPLRRPLVAASFGAALQSALCIVFIALPVVEDAFLRSPLGAVLGGPAVPALFAGERNNVLDPLKSGGMFVNGNVASLYGFVAAAVFAAAAVHWRSRWLGAVALLAAAGALATSSKSPYLILPFALLVLVLCIWRFLGASWKRTVIGIGAVGGLGAVVVAIGLREKIEGFVAAMQVSLGDRSAQWELIPKAWATSPFLGLGHDEWRLMALEEIGQNWPPHNLLLRAWSDAGIPHLALTLVVMAMLTMYGVRAARHTETLRAATCTSMLLIAVLWVFLHGMGDNTTIYGDARTGFFVAVAMGVIALSGGRTAPSVPQRLRGEQVVWSRGANP